MKEKRSKTDRNRNIAPDRISELPESIIHEQILPRLSRRDRARTRVLSTTWYTLNKTYPAFDFDFESFLISFRKNYPKYKNASYLKLNGSRKFRKSLKAFRKRASKRLRHFSRRNLRLHSLRLKFRDDDFSHSKYKSDIGKWIELALKSRVEKLKLHCPGSYYFTPVFPLPRLVYFSATLTTLKLVKCVLDQPLSLFTRIRELTLVCRRIISGPVVLNRPDCLALESLTLLYCKGFDSLRIVDLVRLHRVMLFFTCLVSMEIASERVEKISITEVYYSVPPQFGIKMDDCSCLKFLYLDSVAVTDQDIHSILSKFPLLEELYLYHCSELKALRISSSRLETLVVCVNGLQSIDIEAPTLKNFISANLNHVEIKVKEGNCLETLMLLHSSAMTDGEFHEIVAKFPLLQSLWIYDYYGLERIEIPPNLQQLKRLHMSRCFRLRGVEVSSCHKLFEMYCCCCYVLESIDTAIYSVRSSGRRDCETCLWSVSFREMLMSLVHEKSIVRQICNQCFCCKEC